MGLCRDTLLLVAAIGVVCAVPRSARANPVMPPAFYAVVQHGEDVEITLWADLEGSVEFGRTLVRRNLETDKLEVLFEDETVLDR